MDLDFSMQFYYPNVVEILEPTKPILTAMQILKLHEKKSRGGSIGERKIRGSKIMAVNRILFMDIKLGVS
ncbi:hypothetical protein FRX31_010470 [Thalictrum thalictroides]|uniref:Uncharacterized protein n=1 Tax=Thalictrum thalictroides TaxID=46969 RepID=A0A7J6WTH1_THATH|nr:hypothetical protein FRX31_010470 [Thalictrum thalictroides]